MKITNLLMRLHDKKIDTKITVEGTDFVTEVVDMNTKQIIGVARGKTVEDTLSTILRNLADSKLQNIGDFDMLSKL